MSKKAKIGNMASSGITFENVYSIFASKNMILAHV